MSDTTRTKKVATSRQKYAKKSLLPVVHDWPFAESLTEIEGQAVEALRKWTQAGIDPDYRAELLALELVTCGLYEARNGSEKLAMFAEDFTLSNAEIAAFEVITGFWKRIAQSERRNAKRRTKRALPSTVKTRRD